MVRSRVLESGIELTFHNAMLRAEFLADDLVRLAWLPGRKAPDYAIARTAWPDVEVVHRDGSDHVTLETSRLRLRLSFDGSATYLDCDGRLLRQDDAPALKGKGWVQQSSLQADEHIFGLGERAVGLNLRPGRYRLWNADPSGGYGPGHDPLYMSIPVYAAIHSKGSYMVFHNNPHDGWLTFGDRIQLEFSAGEHTTYFIAGPLESALARYLDLTGRPPLPPRWALGLHQSRWGYRTQDDVQAVLDGYRSHELPLSAVHLDIDYMQGYRAFTINGERFADLAGLARNAHRAGARIVAILDPGVKEADGYDVYQQGLDDGHFCVMPDGKPMRGLVWPGWVGFPDFTRPETRRWWGDMYQRLLDAGIDGFWHDMNEPTCFAAWGDTTFPLSTLHDLEGIRGDHRTAHNLYALQMNRAGFDSLRSQSPKRRPFILTRSGWAGVQRYAWHWTGDTVSSWEDLQMTLPSLLGLSLSGILFSGSDIGGFNGDPDSDLFIRWFALSCLVPFCRIHSATTSPPREPWRFGGEVTEQVRSLIEFRDTLTPYLYSLAAEAAEYGRPILRPTFWFDPADSDLWSIEDSFALGPDLLAAPILKPHSETREVSLPSGAWYDYWDGNRIQGGRTAEVKAAGPMPPLLVREGCILPTQDGRRLVLTLYLPPSGEARGSLYSDSGDGHGPYRWDHFSAQGEGGQFLLEWSTQGSFPFGFDNVVIRVPAGRGRITALAVDGTTMVPGQPTGPFQQASLTLGTNNP
jgi:alpha-glucosidase